MRLGLELFATGLLASIFGSMVGLGGGFLLVPALRLFFGLSPADAAGTSLALVVANSASGAFTYLLQKRVHVKIGLLIALGGLPGSIAGAMLVTRLSEQTFDTILAVLLLAVAADVLWNRRATAASRPAGQIAGIKGMSYRGAVAMGFAVGLVSSLFGIGGGVIVVPSLLYFSELPAHAISATSHFAIVLTSPVGLATHAFQHDIRIADVVPLVLGGLCGGPIGARLSLKLNSRQLLRYVAAALIVAAVSLVGRYFF
ncbi:MAG TPA: sulfite exporter TauE/SafE family protein [Candidatus Baltobacteraceae bacterium]